MKKMLSLMLALMLLLTPVLAMAEDSFSVYTAPDGSCGFTYPSDWTLLTMETIDGLVAASQDEGYKMILEALRSEIKEMGHIIVMSADMISSITIIPQDRGEEVTNEMVAALKDGVVAEVMDVMGDVTFSAEPGMLELDNGRQALLVQYLVPIFEDLSLYSAQAYVGVGNTLFMLTMTSEPDRVEADTEVLKLVLGSLQ